MYPDAESFYKDMVKAKEDAERFTSYAGRLTADPGTLKEALLLYTETMRRFENIYVYAHMKHDEDNGDPKYVEMNNAAMAAAAEVYSLTSFFTPEVLACPEEKLRAFIEEPDLAEYRFMLENMLDEKKHVLSPAEEKLIAKITEALHAPSEIFGVLNDVDMKFGTVKDENGEDVPLTHGSYISLMESKDRSVKKAAFEGIYREYEKHNNTIATAYNFNVKQDDILAKIRHYDSSIDSALSPEKIPLSVYDNLIEEVRDHLPAMHKYAAIRKRTLGLDDMQPYDLYVPIVEKPDVKYTFDEAIDTILTALEPLGNDYVSALENGLRRERWVDIYENEGKTSGAYSFGSYDSYPYILMNFQGDIKDVFTLIHESGHSMHSYFTRREQPFIYGSHSIFTAEVASTVNETLLIKHMLGKSDGAMRAFLLNFYIDEFKSTLFRQTMFAEFEKKVHGEINAGGSLTAPMLNEIYADLNKAYFGDALSENDLIKYEWSRIPHFYSSFYVYQYATGYSAANALANRILSGGKPAVDDYRKFLTLGNSDHPIELLKVAGVDMGSREPVASALSTFDGLVDELEKLI